MPWRLARLQRRFFLKAAGVSASRGRPKTRMGPGASSCTRKEDARPSGRLHAPIADAVVSSAPSFASSFSTSNSSGKKKTAPIEPIGAFLFLRFPGPQCIVAAESELAVLLYATRLQLIATIVGQSCSGRPGSQCLSQPLSQRLVELD